MQLKSVVKITIRYTMKIYANKNIFGYYIFFHPIYHKIG